MKRKKNKEFSHIGDVIKHIIGTGKTARPDAEMLEIWRLWEGIVGKAIAGNARPAAFKGDILLVNVASSPWMQQLQFLKKDIVNKINAAFGKQLVREIKFKIGSI